MITAWQFVTIPKGFLPEVDSSNLNGYTLAAQGISFDEMKAKQLDVNKILMADPNKKGFFSSLGTVGGSSNSGFIFMHLVTTRGPPESSQPGR